MTATVIVLPVMAQPPRGCPRCGGLRRVTFDQMNEAQQRWAPFGAIHPCPDCARPAQVIPFGAASQS